MPDENFNSSDRQRLLDEVVAAYLQAREAGGRPDPNEWLARHPDLAAELAEFFAAEEGIANWARRPIPSKTEAWLPATAAYRGATPNRRPTPGDAAASLVEEPSFLVRRPVAPGDLIANRYRVFDVKAGGMGLVYLADDLEARDRGYELKVAVKTVADVDPWRRSQIARKRPAEASQYGSLLADFHREALAWVRLGRHENIILAMFVIEVGEKPHLIMEYADSGDLASWIKQGRLTIPLAVNFALQFCAGMQHAVQTSGMVHRDIKPANVLIKDNRILKIADFGLSKAYAAAATEDRPHQSPAGAEQESQSSTIGGTPAYAPPEQFLGHADTRSDIFSFGVVLHEMLTGNRLFAESNSYNMASRKASLSEPHALNPAVPAELSAIVQRCLEYDPERRYQSFDALAHALVNVHAGLAGRQPIPRDPKTIPAEDFTPSIQALGESFTLISLGRFEEAARRAQQGIDIDPDNFEHWVNKGKALIELKRFEAARECFQRATELRPGDARSWANLGWTELELGDAARGLASAQRAIGLDAEFADAWMCRGSCQRQLGDPAHAAKAHAMAVYLEPHNWKAQANLGSCLQELERYEEARIAFEECGKINPQYADAWRQLGWLAARRGAWKEARMAIDCALKLEPAHAAAWAVRAWIIWSGTADAATAKVSLNKAFELDPASHQARVVRGVLERANAM